MWVFRLDRKGGRAKRNNPSPNTQQRDNEQDTFDREHQARPSQNREQDSLLCCPPLSKGTLPTGSIKVVIDAHPFNSHAMSPHKFISDRLIACRVALPLDVQKDVEQSPIWNLCEVFARAHHVRSFAVSLARQVEPQVAPFTQEITGSFYVRSMVMEVLARWEDSTRSPHGMEIRLRFQPGCDDRLPALTPRELFHQVPDPHDTLSFGEVVVAFPDGGGMPADDDIQ